MVNFGIIFLKVRYFRLNSVFRLNSIVSVNFGSFFGLKKNIFIFKSKTELNRRPNYFQNSTELNRLKIVTKSKTKKFGYVRFGAFGLDKNRRPNILRQSKSKRLSIDSTKKVYVDRFIGFGLHLFLLLTKRS